MSVLKRPIISEKSQGLNTKGKYTFEVNLNANKIQIAKAVENMYGVTVAEVATITQFGKKKSRMTKTKVSSGRTSTFKKAIVTLKEGELIDFYAEI
ncbi:50S ribosomal protein L23 [Emticicia sp. CRIBPO]|jgi:large subunit ribosomal protein L23|uniref:50S ribosomal protein L23 n=1 Tax=Emticicia sp. CRIBPO TaxID=2683258 RepID=UPI001411D14C|nr:50S ribosomal protein L23 [Emticicia sp. CRIBPO]NBA87466.1 50S ribosomal protein L23 [Emticicia sp. CRIBPO]